MWIVCQADNSHEMSSFILSENITIEKKQQNNRMLSAANLFSTL